MFSGGWKWDLQHFWPLSVLCVTGGSKMPLPFFVTVLCPKNARMLFPSKHNCVCSSSVLYTSVCCVCREWASLQEVISNNSRNCNFLVLTMMGVGAVSIEVSCTGHNCPRRQKDLCKECQLGSAGWRSASPDGAIAADGANSWKSGPGLWGWSHLPCLHIGFLPFAGEKHCPFQGFQLLICLLIKLHRL